MMDDLLWPTYDGPDDVHHRVTDAQAVGRPDLHAGEVPVGTVLDAIPLTPVGKPFKPALGAEATGEAVSEALPGQPGVAAVRGVIEGGAVVAVVELTEGADQSSITETLDRFAITWRMEKS